MHQVVRLGACFFMHYCSFVPRYLNVIGENYIVLSIFMYVFYISIPFEFITRAKKDNFYTFYLRRTYKNTFFCCFFNFTPLCAKILRSIFVALHRSLETIKHVLKVELRGTTKFIKDVLQLKTKRQCKSR